MRASKVMPAILTVVLAALSAGAALDPDEYSIVTPEQLAQRQIAGLVEPLGLSEEQVALIEPVLMKDITRKALIVAGYRGRLDQENIGRMRAELQESHAQTRSELEPILSAKQLETYETVQEQQRAELAGEFMVQRLQGPLQLNLDQRERLTPIFAAHLQKQQQAMREIRGGSSTGMQRMRAMRAEMRELQEALEEELAPILSAEQLEAYREYRRQTQSQMRQRMLDRGSKPQP